MLHTFEVVSSALTAVSAACNLLPVRARTPARLYLGVAGPVFIQRRTTADGRCFARALSGAAHGADSHSVGGSGRVHDQGRKPN